MSEELATNHLEARKYSLVGPGTRFENRLATVFLARILTRRTVCELAGRTPQHLAVQRSSTAVIDDLVLTAPPANGQPAVRLDIAVGHAPGFVNGDDTTNQLVETLVRSDLAAERDSNRHIERRLAVAISGCQSDARRVAGLSARARNHRSPQRFFEDTNVTGDRASWEWLAQLQKRVAAALTQPDMVAAGSSEHRCWSFLSRLRVIESRLESGGQNAWTMLIDDLQPVVPDRSRASAIGLRDRLEQLSAELASRRGEIDGAALRKRLQGVIGPEPSPVCWTQSVHRRG